MPTVYAKSIVSNRITKVEKVAVPKGLPPVSVDDAWMCIRGDDVTAHCFPVTVGLSLCGEITKSRTTERATAGIHDQYAPGPGKRPANYRTYCPACLAIHEYRWLHAYSRKDDR